MGATNSHAMVRSDRPRIWCASLGGVAAATRWKGSGMGLAFLRADLGIMREALLALKSLARSRLSAGLA
ncbi:hypothetical protein GCM10010873_31290 [Cypionkella aquatica]|uniref:Uncharacterized protein n=1 Tax=Cypionkella aquatica TaxID=1756042 RepID=A0AA37TZB3_9RHOB|nr:hypothetical protein GCM10010873_31290 [Cypionkella aquatica]